MLHNSGGHVQPNGKAHERAEHLPELYLLPHVRTKIRLQQIVYRATAAMHHMEKRKRNKMLVRGRLTFYVLSIAALVVSCIPGLQL